MARRPPKKQARAKRRAFRRKYAQLEADAQALTAPLGFTARVMDGVMSVGVQGDGRAYEPVIEISGPYEDVAKVSNLLSNRLRISRVAYTLAVKDDSSHLL